MIIMASSHGKLRDQQMDQHSKSLITKYILLISRAVIKVLIILVLKRTFQFIIITSITGT